MKNANDYQVTRPTVPAQGIGMPYFTLDEAAQYATEQKRFKVEPSVLLRSGVLGMLQICAAFGAGRMHNALTQQEEDLTPCLLIIPPKHLLELETEGVATIHLAHSLDGGMYFPEKQRTREHLRVMVAHLDKFLEMLIDTTQETNTPPAKSKAVTGTSPSGDDREKFSGGFDLDGAPSLRKGRNSPEMIKAWVVWQAKKMVKPNDTLPDLIGRIILEADRWGYESDRKALTENIIRKMLPLGITGGREKNGRK